jgi:serine/threonine-protein kinase
MSVPSPSELLAFLQEHGFLTPSQVQELGGVHSSKFADSRALAGMLVAREWLTAYQANELLQGRGTNLLVGPYRLMDRLGQGGMAQVFRALHASMDRVVALKIIPREQLSNPTARARFDREVRAVAALSHPNIVIAFDIGQAGQTHYLAMEYVDGIDLAKLVQQSGPLPIPKACEFVRQAAIGMQHAHEKGLVHRDIKPGNLMVARCGHDQQPIIKILDFGLARFEREITDGTRLTQLGRIVGTVDYIAPEQAENAQTADIRADIYSLGCSLFYLLTGKPPFTGPDALARIAARLSETPSVRKIRPEVPVELERVVAKMMARRPAERFQTPAEVALVLGPFAQTGRTGAAKATPLAPVARPDAIVASPAKGRQAAAERSQIKKTRPELPGKEARGVPAKDEQGSPFTDLTRADAAPKEVRRKRGRVMAAAAWWKRPGVLGLL